MAILGMNEEMAEQYEEQTGEKSFPVADAGIHEVRVTGVKEMETGPNSKNPGTPMWCVDFVITEEGENKDIKVSNFYQIPGQQGSAWMDEKTVKRQLNDIKQLWMACDVEVVDGNLDTDDLLHASCRLDVTVDPNGGRPRNNVRDVLPVQ